MRYTSLFLVYFLSLFFVNAQTVHLPSIHQEESEKYKYLQKKDSDFPDSVNLTHGFSSIQHFPDCELEKRVFGYQPYWNTSAYHNYQWNLLSDMAYFSYEVNPQTGNPYTTNSWMTAAVIDTALAHGIKVHICATLFSSHSLFFSSEQAKQTLIYNLITLVEARGAHGINIDFEAVPSGLSFELNSFLVDLATQAHNQIPGVILSIAAPAVDWSGLYDLELLKNHIDLFFIMGYDYYWNGSSVAGPVDGLYSMTDTYDYNLSRTVSYYLSKGIAPEQLILGLPYYGRKWPTELQFAPSQVTGYGDAITYYAVKNNYSGNYNEENKLFEPNSFSPYYAYYTDGWNQCFINDVYSLGKRYDMINRLGLAGSGIWALGYDSGHNELWELIANKFSNCAQPILQDTIYDSGGPAFDYYNNEDYVISLGDINNPGGSRIKIIFDQFDTEQNYDFLRVFDGPDTLSDLIGIYSGVYIPQITSTEGSLCLHFKSDAFNTAMGWQAIRTSETVDINELIKANVIETASISPNPCQGNISIEFEIKNECNLSASLYSVTGKTHKLFEKRNFIAGKQKIQLHLNRDMQLSAGKYTIVIFNEMNIVISLPVIISY